MSLEDGVTVVPTGKLCWGCDHLFVERVALVGEDFYCVKNPENRILLGRIRKIMDGSIFPREIEKGCYNGGK